MIFTIKNPAYGRHQLSWPMRIVIYCLGCTTVNKSWMGNTLYSAYVLDKFSDTKLETNNYITLNSAEDMVHFVH